MKIIVYCLLLVVLPLSSLKAQYSKRDTFNAKKYDKMVEIDVKGLFSTGPGSGLIYRKKHESGNFVFVDRTRFWRFGFYFGGSGVSTRSDSVGVNIPSNASNGIFASPSIGHETMFHFGRFNLFYAGDLVPSYQYIDETNSNKLPCIAHKFGLGISFSAGMRYFIHERFSIAVQSTPLSLQAYYEKIRYYRFFDSATNVYVNKKIDIKEKGFRINQLWLSSLGFTYHF